MIPIQSRFSPRLIPAAITDVTGDNHHILTCTLLEFSLLLISIIKNYFSAIKMGGEISIKCATVLITNTVTYIRPSGNTATEYKQGFKREV